MTRIGAECRTPRANSDDKNGLVVVAIDINAVKSRTLEVRGQHVLLDRDVAVLYGVETKAVNQAVKRNAERFYDGYILTLTAEECSRSQIVTLNGTRGSNIKYLHACFYGKGSVHACDGSEKPTCDSGDVCHKNVPFVILSHRIARSSWIVNFQ